MPAARVTGVATGAWLTLLNETLPTKTLLRLLSAAPSLAWIEKVGAVTLPSCTKRTWLAARSAVVKVVALVQVTPSVVVWKLPWVTLLTVKAKLELSGSLTPILAGVISTVPPSATASDAAVITGASLTAATLTVTVAGLLVLAPSLTV